MNKMFSSVIDSELYEAQSRAFERIDEQIRNYDGTLPSDVGRYLEKYYGLGEAWIEWWEESGDEYK